MYRLATAGGPPGLIAWRLRAPDPDLPLDGQECVLGGSNFSRGLARVGAVLRPVGLREKVEEDGEIGGGGGAALP